MTTRFWDLTASLLEQNSSCVVLVAVAERQHVVNRSNLPHKQDHGRQHDGQMVIGEDMLHISCVHARLTSCHG